MESGKQIGSSPSKPEFIPPEPAFDWMNPLMTDHYQITMSYAYFNSNRHQEHSIFEAFFRKHPFKGKYCIFAGVQEVIAFIKNFKFTPSHVAYLKTQMPQASAEYFEWLESLDGSQVKVYGIKEGHLVFAKEPLLRLEGPIGIL